MTRSCFEILGLVTMIKTHEFCRRQGIKMHETAELSLSLSGKAGAKATYLVRRKSHQGKKSKK